MASYNGEKFIEKQIKSILSQLQHEDELIIVDDCSQDSTLKIINELNDPRIKLYSNDQNRSHVYTFGRAISLASHNIIFMADQDDIWIHNRVKLMSEKMKEEGVLVVSSNSDFMDFNEEKIDYIIDGVTSKDSKKYLKNILTIFAGKTNYYGCAMVINKRILKVILPIPHFVESHDLWIALAGNLMRSNFHIDEKTLIRRVHGNNASIVDRKLSLKLWSRVIFLLSIIVIGIRIIKNKIS